MEASLRRRLSAVLLPALGLLLLAGGLAYVFRDHLLEGRAIRDLETGDWLRQGEAAERLGRIRSRKAVPALVQALEREPQESADTLRARAFFSSLAEPMGKVTRAMEVLHGAEAHPFLEVVSEIFVDPAASVKLRMIETLGEIGPPAAEAVPALARCLRDPRWMLRTAAAQALGEIRADPEHAVPALAAALEDPQELVRRKAAMALGRFGKAAAPAAPALRRLLEDPDEDLRRIAGEVLQRIERP